MCVYKRRMCLPEGARVAVALVAAFELALKRLLAPVRHHVAVPATHANIIRTFFSKTTFDRKLMHENSHEYPATPFREQPLLAVCHC